jgi:hypothetical protein
LVALSAQSVPLGAHFVSFSAQAVAFTAHAVVFSTQIRECSLQLLALGIYRVTLGCKLLIFGCELQVRGLRGVQCATRGIERFALDADFVLRRYQAVLYLRLPCGYSRSRVVQQSQRCGRRLNTVQSLHCIRHTGGDGLGRNGSPIPTDCI